MVTIRKSVGRVSEFESVVWDVFFQSRNRGVSLTRHFPWLLKKNEPVYYMLAEVEGHVVGGLVIREWIDSSCGHKFKIGLIGLVCIAPNFRGQGIANELLDKTLKQATADSFDVLTLWTGKPELYRRHGFVDDDAWTYGWAHRVHGKSPAVLLNDCFATMIELKRIAIPPFALSVHELVGAKSSVLVVKDEVGWIIAGYKGNVKEVIFTIKKILPDNWRINLKKDDILGNELQSSGYDLNLKPVNLQMWLCIDPRLAVAELVKKLRISVLERI